MSRTDKDTPWWVVEQRPEASTTHHDHRRTPTGPGHDGACDIARDGHFPKRFNLVMPEHAERQAQHVDSGACHKWHAIHYLCRHDVLGRPDHACGEVSFITWYNNELAMLNQGYSEHEIDEWVALNGVVHEHHVTKDIYDQHAPCKCDAWVFAQHCTRSVDWDKSGHGHVGLGRWRREDRSNGRVETDLNRCATRNELNTARFLDWRDELLFDE